MQTETSAQPILYSFRRCPYAIRARFAIASAGIQCELREVALKDKPAEMLAASPKGTVPVAVLQNGNVIDESIDLMCWAFEQNDPEDYLSDLDQSLDWVGLHDSEFLYWLNRYKYFVGYPENNQEYYRMQAELFVEKLEGSLESSSFIVGANARFADVALFPFVRQFALVDFEWFASSKYKRVNQWLASFVESDFFAICMEKQPLWVAGQRPVYFPPEPMSK